MRVAMASINPQAGRFGRSLDAIDIKTELMVDTGDVDDMVRSYDLDLLVIDERLVETERTIVQLRHQHRTIPILVIGTDMLVERCIAVLADGADDIVAWATDIRVVAARIRALVRRYRGADFEIRTIGHLRFDIIRRSLTHNSRPVPLTAKEYAVLEAMVLRRGTILTKEALLDQLYGGRDMPGTRTIDVFVCQLRKKLAAYGLPDVIETVRGLGYLLNDARPVPAPGALPVLAATA